MCCFLLVLALLGCGDQGKDPGTSASTGANDIPVGLRLLTWRYLAQDAAIVKEFETRFRTKVEVKVRPMREIVADAQAGRPLQADVLLLPTMEDAVRMKGFNMLQPFFVDAFTNGDVGDNYLDRDGYYAGLTQWTMAAVYNPNAVTSEEAGTYRGLAEVPLRGIRLGVAHPDSSGLASVIGALHANLNPDAAALWTNSIYRLAAGGLQGSDYDQLDRMLAGELDMALVSMGAIARWFLNGDPKHYEAGGAWRVRFPHTQATNVNFINMTCITMPANAPNRNMAVGFINYMFSKEVQEQLSNAWFEFPTHAFAEANEYLYGFPDRLGYKLSAESLEQNIPIGWALVNAQAEQ